MNGMNISYQNHIKENSKKEKIVTQLFHIEITLSISIYYFIRMKHNVIRVCVPTSHLAIANRQTTGGLRE